MLLTDEEKRMLDGEHGPGAQRSMSLLVKMGEAFDAEKTVPVNLVHISTNIPLGLVKELTEGVRRTKALSSLHAIFDPIVWREKYGVVAKGAILGGMGVTDEQLFSSRLGVFLELGFLPTFTCLPYASGIIVRPGDVTSWTGSSGQVFCNSILGARAPREGSSSALASAVTGRTPLAGLLKQENRYGTLLLKAGELDFGSFTNADYGALGYHAGSIARDRNVVFQGLPAALSPEQCKFITSPLPVSGACNMCHIVGVTPEAPTLEHALGNRNAEAEVPVGAREIEDVYRRLNTADSDDIDLVVIGCPHCSIAEIREIASLLRGRKVREGVSFSVGTSDPIYTLAKASGYTDAVERSGAFFTNCCVSALNPLVHIAGARAIATNSSRGAHYIQATTAGKAKTFYGDVSTCVEAAIAGKWRG